jgi:long-chain acyl-CoA synthetase
MPLTIDTDTPFIAITDLLREHARERPEQTALINGNQSLSYAALDVKMNRVAAALQRDGLKPGDCIAICATSSLRYAALYLGALRAGVVVAPLALSVTRDSLAAMLRDAGAKRLFVDRTAADLIPDELPTSR